MHDVIIIGAGPAGYTAALYSKRYNLGTLVLGFNPGGTVNEAMTICNYPGWEDIDGPKLMKEMKTQVENLGAEVKQDKVIDVKKQNGKFIVKTRNEKTYQGKVLVLATGTEKRRLKMEDCPKFLGKGISYCVTCDGALYKDKITGVVGGRDSAAKAAVFLSNIAKKVYIIYRRDELRAEPALKKEVEKQDNIDYVFNATPIKAEGGDFLERVKLDNGEDLELDGLFIEIGSIPNTELAKDLNVSLDEDGYIEVNDDMSTNVKGVYAAGDVTTGSNKFRQIVTAASEGAIAAESLFDYIKRKE